MAAAAPEAGAMSFNPGELQQRFDRWVKEQHPAVEVATATLASAAQGALIGYLLGSFTLDPQAAQGQNASPQMSQQLAALQKGGPWGQARNLGVFTGVNAGLSLAIKKARGGKEDVWGS
jgi:membrane protein YqaA with SNARE-associated domain